MPSMVVPLRNPSLPKLVRISCEFGVSCEEIACIEWKVEAKRIVSFVENFSPPDMIYKFYGNDAYLMVDKRPILVDYEYGDMHLIIIII
jgi:hypothetical protein